MKNILKISFAALILLFYSCSNGQQQSNQSPVLTPNEFAEKIKNAPNALIVDARTPPEFSKGHLQNAVNIDWNGNDFDAKTATLDKSKPILIYCLSGARSAAAANKMRTDGFKEVYELGGGILKWRAANLPETTENSTPSVGMTQEQFNTMVQSDKWVLVDFYADWCAPCKKMKPYLDEISAEMADKVLVKRINADENPALCKILKIESLPVLQIYKNNQLTWTNEGFIEKSEVIKHFQ